ncbi:MAG: hypothetical protein U1D30_18705 [Planctomycetota bacterium]
MSRSVSAMSLTLLIVVNAGAEVRIDQGPILLHEKIEQQWGGHTFAYLLEGERFLFWSASELSPNPQCHSVLVGRYPKSKGFEPAVTRIPLDGENVKNKTQPLLVRSKDGHVHVFVGVGHGTSNPNYAPGEIRYYRSHEPEDISELVDRTELIPRVRPYTDFHLRMNVGISRDGERMVLVVLAISQDGSVPFNTPVVFLGEKKGSDFVFAPPKAYAPAMGLFYPQVAVTESGTVVVGQVWDHQPKVTTRLMVLDAEGTLTHREDLPADSDGMHVCYDLRPASNDDRGRLILYYNKYPKGGTDCRHELWEFLPATKSLRLLRSVPTAEGMANAGKWLPTARSQSLLLNNPSMGRFQLWEGNLLGEGAIQRKPLLDTDPATMNFVGSAYTFVPNTLQGSVLSNGGTWFATDYIPRDKPMDARGPASLMLFHLAFSP